jgi:hypothetical protein
VVILIAKSFPGSSPPRQGGVSAKNFTILHYVILNSFLRRIAVGEGFEPPQSS